ncbi:phage virion morphogenesis protein [Paenibacillus melissococcoides]|uniref:Phage virion morphogenesis protein n=1 Tax=Paenibacillus melissococcoides TaxID=2912268 RepID=A0ABM9GCY1_9BACL|nr:phage virion morphogenesis protein [Paenibacillus melissococcoides]CAH8249895.1 phage virion morphogenesis protein [Paenibacillus melissococcoides]
MKRLRKLQEVDIRRTGLVLAEALRTSTLERFKEQKGPDGKAWSTSIRASQENGSTLTDSARLKNSIKSTADGSGLQSERMYYMPELTNLGKRAAL